MLRLARMIQRFGKPNNVSPLTIFGLFAVTAMLVFYALEKRSPWFILAFASSCLLGSAYGFLQGAWPFGIVEFIWAGVAAETHRSCRNTMISNHPRLSFRIARSESSKLRDMITEMLASSKFPWLRC